MDNRNDWNSLLKANPTDWLLETNDPGVRYLALRDIVEASDKDIKTARAKAHRMGPIAQILDNMAPTGYWVQPGTVYSPKCRGTVWSIISLAQLGACVEEDKRVVTACTYLLDHAMAKGGQLSSTGEAPKTFNCLQGNLLTSLLDLGCQDSRLDVAFEWTARTVTGDGLPLKVTSDGLTSSDNNSTRLHPLSYITGPLFACRSTKHCAWGGVKVMMAFSRLPAARRSNLIEQAIEAGTKYFFSSDPSTANFPGEMAPVPDKRWWKFHFPVIGFDILQVAEALTALGYGSDSRLANTLDLIRQKQNEDGRWLLEENYGYWHKWWVKYGSKGKPNKWVTLRALRVLKQAVQQKQK